MISGLRRFAGAVVLSIFTAACQSGAAPVAPATSATVAATPVAGGTVTVRLNGDWVHFDPQHPKNTAGIQGGQIESAFYDSLLAWSPDFKLVPYLATSWEQTPTKLTFTLRNDATCADGTKITPSVVKGSFERAVNAVGAASRFGPPPYTMVADDAANTFSFTLSAPLSDAIYSFAGNTGAIVCPAGLANPDSLTNTPAGSGPYVLDSAVPGDQVVVKLRPDWKWGPGGLTAQSPGLPERIIFKVISNETTAANLLLTGGLDVARVAGTDVDRLSADKSVLHKSAASFIVFPLVFNGDPGHPTTDEKVREALVSAVDPNQWNQIVYKGRGEVSPTFVSSRNDCYDASAAQYLPKDPSPEKARGILLAAGWTAGPDGKLVKDGEPLRINFDATTAGLGSGPEYIAEQWSKAGITVDAHIVEFNTYLQSMLQGNFDALIQQTSGDYPDPNAGVQFFLGQAPYPNIARTVNNEAAAEREQARATIGDERCAHWANVQRLLLQQHNYLPLASPVTDWFSHDIEFVPGVQSVDPRFLKRIK